MLTWVNIAPQWHFQFDPTEEPTCASLSRNHLQFKASAEDFANRTRLMLRPENATPAPTLPGSAADENADRRDPPPVSGWWVALLVLALLGVNLAFIPPMVISLAIRIDDLAPGRESYLGFILGAGSAAALLVGPLGGQLSDRTRSRFGRRRPWVVGGFALGFIALFIMALAPTVGVLAGGWILAQLGFSQALGNLAIIQADRLPPQQRGKVAGVAASASVVASILGALLATSMAQQPVLLLMAPAAIALILVAPFVLLAREEDSRSLVIDEALNTRLVLSKYVFSPRRYPDFFRNLCGRMLFFFGLTLATTYTAYFFASRLGLTVTEVGSFVAMAGALGIAGLAGGALGSGFLSDRISRRKPFVLVGGILFALGALTTAIAPDLPQLLVGSFVCNLAIGVFTATDQALLLDLLPERDTEAGRFLGIAGLSTTIPQALAPIVASLLLTVGDSSSDQKNYLLIYLVAAVLTVLGGLVVMRVKSVR